MPESANRPPHASQPALRGERLVFAAAGELWLQDLGERTARRLTDSTGTASRPVLSPDGRRLAFAATDEGPNGLWLMDLEEGEARRLVVHASPCEPLAFSPDGERVYFLSALSAWSPRLREVHSVALDGSDPRREPWGPANAVAWSGDGRLLALGRGYQDPAAWKRYAGGLAGRIWAGPAEGLELACLSPGPRGDSCPGFWGERVVFLSDEEGCGNLWSCALDGSDRRRHTSHEGIYVRFPSVDGGRVAYQRAGDVHLLDLETGEDEILQLRLESDASTTRRRFVDPLRFLEGGEPSPDGKQVLLVTRGKAFAMPAWRGPVRTLGDEDGVRFSHAAWLPDGERVVLAHDASGEEEIEVRRVDGAEPPRSLGRAGEGRLRLLSPSPDGRLVALSEQAAGLQVLDLDSGERRPVARPASGAVTEVSWSPDGRWLAYALPVGSYRGTIHLFDTRTGEDVRVTSDEFDDGSPCFDPAGRVLWFLSRRVYNPFRDELEHDVGFPATTKPFAVVLAAGRPSPFAPLPDAGETAEPDEAPAGGANAEGADEETPEPVRVDPEGIAERVVEVPVPEGRHAALLATKERLFLLERPLRGLVGPVPGSGGDEAAAVLKAFDLRKRERETWLKGVRGASLSADGSQLLVRGAKGLRLVSTKSAPKPDEVAAGPPGEKSGVLDLSRLRVRVAPRAEWRQIFREAWRQQRGHFWTECMSRVDWAAMYERYEPLLDRIRSRSELNDLLWDLQGELGTSHAYVVGGDAAPRETVRTALLGAELELDGASGRYRFTRVMRGDSWAPDARGPLAAPGVDVGEGDWLLAVDGKEVRAPLHPWWLLENAGPAVSLRVADSAEGEGAREVVVEPLASEAALRYREWVRANQEEVERRTEGRVGYLHVPDMHVHGLVEFHRGYLWQSDRDALIVDVRDNGGGNVSQILLGKLRRRLIGYCKARWAEPQPIPQNTMDGPLVALCNERTGSDGDIFCQSWRQLGLGPLIGQRTWGGVVGIDRGKSLVDGGYITQPEYAFWFKDRGWDVEGGGVAPDIEVPITPADHAADRDPQLERAIEEALRLLEDRGPRSLELPPAPDRSR